MPVIGGYETVRELGRSAFGSVFQAKLSGGASTLVIKTRQSAVVDSIDEPVDQNPVSADATNTTEKTNQPAPDGELAHFLNAARIQQQAAQPNSHWAVIHKTGVDAGAAFYVTDLYPRSVARLVAGRAKLDPRALHAIIEGVLAGLVELHDSAGASHGNLKPTNVLIGTGNLLTAAVVLTDPTTAGRAVDDTRALGDLIHQLVLWRPYRSNAGWPIDLSPGWQRLGSRGQKWLELANLLLDPLAEEAPINLPDLVDRVSKLKPSTTARFVLGGATATLALAVAATVYGYAQYQHAWTIVKSDTADQLEKTIAFAKDPGNEMALDGTVSSSALAPLVEFVKEHPTGHLSAKKMVGEDIPVGAPPLKWSVYCDAKRAAPIIEQSQAALLAWKGNKQSWATEDISKWQALQWPGDDTLRTQINDSADKNANLYIAFLKLEHERPAMDDIAMQAVLIQDKQKRYKTALPGVAVFEQITTRAIADGKRQYSSEQNIQQNLLMFNSALAKLNDTRLWANIDALIANGWQQSDWEKQHYVIDGDGPVFQSWLGDALSKWAPLVQLLAEAADFKEWQSLQQYVSILNRNVVDQRDLQNDLAEVKGSLVTIKNVKTKWLAINPYRFKGIKDDLLDSYPAYCLSLLNQSNLTKPEDLPATLNRLNQISESDLQRIDAMPSIFNEEEFQRFQKSDWYKEQINSLAAGNKDFPKILKQWPAALLNNSDNMVFLARTSKDFRSRGWDLLADEIDRDISTYLKPKDADSVCAIAKKVESAWDGLADLSANIKDHDRDSKELNRLIGLLPKMVVERQILTNNLYQDLNNISARISDIETNQIEPIKAMVNSPEWTNNRNVGPSPLEQSFSEPADDNLIAVSWLNSVKSRQSLAQQAAALSGQIDLVLSPQDGSLPTPGETAQLTLKKKSLSDPAGITALALEEDEKLLKTVRESVQNRKIKLAADRTAATNRFDNLKKTTFKSTILSDAWASLFSTAPVNADLTAFNDSMSRRSAIFTAVDSDLLVYEKSSLTGARDGSELEQGLDLLLQKGLQADRKSLLALAKSRAPLVAVDFSTQVKAAQDRYQAMLGSAAHFAVETRRATELLDLGFQPDEKIATGETAGIVYNQWKNDSLCNQPELDKALSELRDRVAKLLNFSNNRMSDYSKIASWPIEYSRAVLLNGRLLPSDSRFAGFISHYVGALNAISDQSRNRKLMLLSQCCNQLIGTTPALSSDVDISAQLAVCDHTFPEVPENLLKAISAPARYNWQLFKLNQKLAGPMTTPEAKAGAMTAVQTFTSDGAALLPADQATAIKNVKDNGALVLDSKVGPAAYGWKSQSIDENIRRFTSVAFRDPLTLDFHRVPAGNHECYVCTTELTVGLFISLLNQAAQAAPSREDYFKAVTEKLHEPLQISDWNYISEDDHTKGLKMATAWARPNAATSSPEWVKTLEMAKPSKIRGDLPMQSAPPAAGLYISELLGCRLPSRAEWLATYRVEKVAEDAAKESGTVPVPNLRDLSFATDWRGHKGDEHDNVILAQVFGLQDSFDPGKTSTGDVLVGPEKEISAFQSNDASTFFVTETTTDSMPFHHLIGNVGEVLFDPPAGAVLAEAATPLPTGASDRLSRAEQELSAGKLYVAGGSALSSPGNGLIDPTNPTSPVAPIPLTDATASFDDVGFRLAFTADSQSYAQKVLKLLADVRYQREAAVPPTTP